MYEEVIKDIRKRCRLAMNGVASTSMRQQGLAYKVNFGLNIQQIKDLAQSYQESPALATELWKEGTRELKILATLLYPASEFTIDTANKWVVEIPNQEIREQVCFNLFQNLPFANQIATQWGNSKDQSIRTTGCWLLARLLLLKKTDNVTIESFSHIWEDLISDDISLRNAASLCIKHIGRQSKIVSDNILRHIEVYKNNDDILKREIYDSLSFEFEYFFEN